MLNIALLAAAAIGSAAPHDHDHLPVEPPRSFQVISDTEIIADGVTFDSWQALADSGYFHQMDTRCATSFWDLPDDPARGIPADCSLNNTNPAPAYAPSISKLRIPVVVHVIQNSSGTGFIPESRVRSQIDILNEDFLALTGTNGSQGFDTQIEFYLATEDPNGNPTTGITYTTNTSWFNDSGTYYNTLAWDTDRYLNIYTNSASGALGYVPALPQEGIVGSNADRVVCLYSAFGRNAPLSPYNQGRTATHEVGHYLGLFHTFNGGCASASGCSGNGDRICDTNPESQARFGCPGSATSCGTSDPYRNYMDYTDDLCMTNFTEDQGYRMRCTLINYRPAVFSVDNPAEPCPADLSPPIGSLDIFDILAYIELYNAQDPAADLDDNGSFSIFDILEYIELYNAGCP